MAKRPPLLLDTIADGEALRERLTALTLESGGNGDTPEIRTAVMAMLKEVLATGRARCEALLLEDGSGQACANRLSYLADTIVSTLHDFAMVHVLRVANPSAGERMAVCAVGGYGRGALAPGSDLDLMFLLPDKQTATGERTAEYMLYMLWDLGLTVGHSTRSVDECIRQAQADMTIRTAVLEARLLHGEASLFEELARRFDNEVVKSTGREFIEAKLAERDARHTRSGRTRYRVEPNVKEGKGGQRDLHTLFWIAKYHYRLPSQDQLREAKVFSAAEFRTFSRAQSFLWAVRCHLHFVTGRAEERLTFDLQPALAQRLGYAERRGLSAVERFMKHYFLTAKDVGDLTRILCAELEEEQVKSPRGVVGAVTGMVRKLSTRRHAIAGTDHFVEVNGRIQLADPDVFERDPTALVCLFRFAERDGLMFHPDALQAATRNLRRIDVGVRRDAVANGAFMDVLTSSGTPERTLRVMNETGVLGRFLPDFGKIVAMMQFNMYHHFTVDEHLLQSVGVLSNLERGIRSEEHPLSAQILAEGRLTDSQRKVLYVALLLHDVAKGRPEDHSIAGAKIAKRLCPRLGLDADETALVAWLIEHHLLMSTTAQSRDLNDPRTIADFAAIMGTGDRMRLLIILTVCDITAVGPGTWTSWKGTLLRTLFRATLPYLEGNETAVVPPRERAAEARKAVARRLSDWDATERDRVLALPYDDYWLGVTEAAAARRLTVLRDADVQSRSVATAIKLHEDLGVTEITLLAPDHPRLLSTITGCCAAAGANIVDAQIHTTRDGRALDSIFVSRAFERDDDEERRAGRIAASIEDVLAGRTRMASLLEAREGPKARERAFRVKPVVEIDNGVSDNFTVIDIRALDRPGLLSDIANALADLTLDVASAHVVTFGEKAQDTFYVRDFSGSKIDTPAKLDAVRARLLEAVAPERREREAV